MPLHDAARGTRPVAVVDAVGQHGLMPTFELVPRPARRRFELLRDGVHVGHVIYVMRDDVLVLEHTIVLAQYGGQGLGSILARAVLDHLRQSGISYEVECPFLRGWIAKHPDQGLSDGPAQPSG